MAGEHTGDDPIIPQGVTLRAFDDTKAARAGIYSGTIEALKKRFPLESKSHRLELSDIRYTGPQEFTLAQQKHALLSDKPLHTPITGHFRLVDKASGAVVDELDEVVMDVPYYTDRGTVINNGSEYTIANQLRLRPGVYTRIRRSGDVETQFNVKPGTGRGFRLRMDPSTGVVTVNVGHANMPLYPLLRTMGVTDQQMIKAWGSDVAYANAEKANSTAGRSAVDKLYKAFAGYNATAQDLVSKERYIAETLPKFALDPGVTSRTLGIAAEGITPEVLLRAASKMFNVNRGEEKPDDRDNPGFANVYGVEDLYRERIEKDAGKLSRNIMWKLSRSGSLKPLGRAAFSGWHRELLQGSGLAMPGDNSNPMALEEQMLRVTRMGEGGIGSADVITDEARQINPGNLNFIDLLAGPENERVGVDARLGVYTRKGSDGRLYSLFINRQGRKEYIASDTASDSVIGFPNPDPKADSVPAMKDGRVQMVPRSEVDYFVPSMAGLFSSNVNLNPMPTSLQGGRQFYGAKFWGQYMPTVNGEVPLVDSLMSDGKSTWGEHYGRKLGTLRSPAAGTVTKVSDKGVTVTDESGKKHFVETVVDFPFNGLTGLTYTPTVKVGDTVAADDMVAASNFVDKKTGGLAMGHNLHMAWLPYKGFSYEDSIVISESAAKKLATDRLYGFEADPRDGVELGLGKYMSAFPKKFTKEQFATLDDNGVVKEGTVLNKGDPISVGVGPKLLTAEDANLGKLSKVLRNAFTDKAQVWDHDYPGTVVSSTVFRGRAKVNVKATPPIQIGDKLSPRGALKGVAGRIIPDDKMPRDAVTNEPYDILMNPMGIPSRVAPGQLIETALGKLAKATGKQVRIPQDPPPEGWAMWASNQLASAGVSPTADVFDPETGRTLHGIGDGYVYFHAMHHLADKKISAKGGAGGYTADLQPAKGGKTGAKRMCFIASQPIRVLHGEESIGHIVEKRIPEYVWTRFADGSWGYSLVTNWFCRKGKVSEVLSISVDGLPGSDNCSRKRVVYTGKTMHVTRQHHLYSPDRGEILAGDVRPGDWLTSYGYVPTHDQMSLLMGSMLGDGAICNVHGGLWKVRGGKTANMAYFSEQHSHHQDAYVRWKVRSLGALVSSRTFTQGKSRAGFGFEEGARVSYYDINRHDIVYKLRDMFYRQPDGRLGRKCLHGVDLSKVGDVGIVAWFVDDGCIVEHTKGGKPTGSPSGTIATLGFTAEENARLASWLQSRLGARVTVRNYKGRYKGKLRRYTGLGLSADACRAMARLVARYMRPEDIPQSKKWLVREVAAMPHLYVGVDTAYTLGSVPVLVTDVRPYVDPKHGPDDEICLYDITVAGSHKYCASDCLVSNSGLDTYALIAHGATEVMKDVQTVRGTKNEEFWKSVRSGGPLPAPQVPFVYQKAMNLLRAGGINVVEGQTATDIMPMTDADTEKLTGGRLIENSRMLDDDMSELKGGLFDPYMTGGNGNRSRWAAIALPEPIPNPVMEEPVRRLLGLTGKKLQAIISGEEKLNGLTGGKALQAALGTIDVDTEIARQRDIARKSRGSVRDNAVKVVGYLSGCKKQGVSPKDWMISKVPVIPPMFRPIAKLGDTALVSDINELYRDVIESADAFRQLKADIPDSGLAEERMNVYNAVKAAYGLGDPISPEGQAKRIKGAIRQVIGTSPKCYDTETEILTDNRGWVGVASLKLEDTVATVNPGTLALEWQRPAEVIHSPYIGPMVHTVSNKVDILVTPNHKHFVSWRIGHGRREFGDLHKIDAVELLYCRNRGHMLTAPTGGQRGTAPRAEFGALRFLDLDALSRFVGMYIAEGWISKNQVNLCQAEHSVHVPYIDDICARLGVPVKRSVYDRRPDRFSKRPCRVVWWTVSCTEFAEWVRTACGAGSAEKRISAEVLAWDSRYLRGLLEAYMRGDGESNKGRVHIDRDHCVTYKHTDPITVYGSRASTTSRALVDDMANLCMRIGLGFRMTRVAKFDNPRWATQYRFRVDGWNRVVIGDSYVKTEWAHYAGTVHCCTVENGLLVVRRHGKTFVSGNSGLWQSKVLSKTVDGVGRAVISPEPNYDMDQCGIPEDAAWTLYKDYVIRGLRRRGYPEERAMQLIEERAKVAKDLLVEEMGRRPVILDRAPTWHKFNLMAFWPTLVEGDTMRMNPVVEKAYTADHDGDQILGKIVISCNLSELNAVTVVGGRKVSVKKLLHGAVKNGILRAMNIKKDIPLMKAATDGESIVVVDFEDIPVGKLERTTQGQNGPIEWYKPAVPFSVAAYDEQTGAPVWAPVRWVTKHPQRVVEVVTLNYGNQIITDDDPRAVYGMDPASPDMAMARFTPSDALARHVVVPVARGTMQQLCSSAGALDNDGVLPLNGDTGYLIGALAGDGWWDKRDYAVVGRLTGHTRHVYIADLHGDVAVRVEQVLRRMYAGVCVSHYKYTKADDPSRYGDTVRHTFVFDGVEELAAHLTEILGGEGDAGTSGSANKHLPVYMLNTSAEFRRGMLCGLMDTDGTVALTKGGSRTRPQLALQFVSTSLRLCRDVALLAESLGVRASVSFSKQTVRGNSAWMTVLSAKDAKATDVLSGLADAGKRGRFIQAEVAADHVNSAFDTVVLPLVVRDALLPWLPATTKDERADYQRVWQAKEHGVIARYIVPRILARLEKLWADRKVAIADAAALLADKAARRDYSVTPEEIAVVRRGITMLAHKSGDRALYDAGQRVYKNTVRPLKTGRMPESTLALLYGFLKDTEVGPCVTESTLVRLWRERFVANESVGWDRVVAVEKTGKREDGYDLNVPGYETYMSVDGTILSNTMNFHVPASDKAVAEAVEKMLPSKNLFSTTDLRSPRYVPMMEMTLGLAKLTAPASDAKPKVFVTARDAIRAYRRGEVGANDPVTVLEAQ